MIIINDAVYCTTVTLEGTCLGMSGTSHFWSRPGPGEKKVLVLVPAKKNSGPGPSPVENKLKVLVPVPSETNFR